LFIGLVSVILIFGGPVALVLGIILLVSRNKKNKYLHEERLKMIESGLITDPEELEKVQLPLVVKQQDMIDIGASVLLFIIGILFAAIAMYAVMCGIIFVNAQQQTMAVAALLLSGIGVFTFTLAVKKHPVLHKQKVQWLLGCVFLTGIIGVMFLNQLSHISLESIRPGIKDGWNKNEVFEEDLKQSDKNDMGIQTQDSSSFKNDKRSNITIR
jgi:drug/metabolite transporter (DMT)-like permease